MKRLLAFVLVAVATHLFPAAAAAQDLVITNARIIVGNGQVITSGSIMIRGGQIGRAHV